MESISEVTTEVEAGMVDAATLRDMTLTKEELYDKQKRELMSTIMSTMVSHATSNGSLEYSVQLNPQFDKRLLDDIISAFETLGYNTEIGKNSIADQETLLLHLSWKEDSNVSDRPENK